MPHHNDRQMNSHLAYGFYNRGIDNGTVGHITWRFVQLSGLKRQLSGLQLTERKNKKKPKKQSYVFTFFLPNNKSLYPRGGAKKLERFNLFYTAKLLIK